MWLTLSEEWIGGAVGRKVGGMGGGEEAGTGIVRLEKTGFFLTKIK